MLIKQKRKPSGKRDNVSQMQQQVSLNWSDMLPPPPEHPPPSECGDPLYHEIRGEPRSTSRSPMMSPVSFSQLSACSCPNPHTQTPVSGWNMPLYSDSECPRCHSEKYYDPMTYCQEPYIRRTSSPRTQLMQQQANARNIPNNANVSVHSCSPRGTPGGSVHYQYSQPHRGFPPQKCATPQLGDKNNFTNNVSNVNRASHSSHSDNEGQGLMPCLQSYRITPKEEKDPRYFRAQWGPDPAPPCEQVSGMGLEEDGTGHGGFDKR